MTRLKIKQSDINRDLEGPLRCSSFASNYIRQLKRRAGICIFCEDVLTDSNNLNFINAAIVIRF